MTAVAGPTSGFRILVLSVLATLWMWSSGVGVTAATSLSSSSSSSSSTSSPSSTSSTSTSSTSTSTRKLQDTSSPVIGILSQPLHPYHRNKGVSDSDSDNDDSDNDDINPHYIAASYVKWLEAGGARSIPIPYDADSALLDDLLSQVNAVLLPGGAAPYTATVTLLLDKIVALAAADSDRDSDHFFPVWGTCLGFEFLVQYGAAGGPGTLQSGFSAENVSLPLRDVQPVNLYSNAAIFKTVTQNNVTMNNHRSGITPDRFHQDQGLSRLWRVTSVNTDLHGRPFVSTMEPLYPDHFPFYGVQYHPEKNAFEYATYPDTNIPYEAIDHSAAGIAVSMYTATFFVDLARRNLRQHGREHSYTKEGTYPPIYTYPIRVGLGFEQIYLVPTADHWTNRTNRTHLRSSSNRIASTSSSLT
jgi:gamma-glutamyl hydrolase